MKQIAVERSVAHQLRIAIMLIAATSAIAPEAQAEWRNFMRYQGYHCGPGRHAKNNCGSMPCVSHPVEFSGAVPIRTQPGMEVVPMGSPTHESMYGPSAHVPQPRSYAPPSAPPVGIVDASGVSGRSISSHVYPVHHHRHQPHPLGPNSSVLQPAPSTDHGQSVSGSVPYGQMPPRDQSTFRPIPVQMADPFASPAQPYRAVPAAMPSTPEVSAQEHFDLHEIGSPVEYYPAFR